ncbi:bifunctional C97 family peptidase/thioredoxin family protein [Aspergillus aculeatinus CBS 121060]|uniref:Thioredoxin n=1 Tax=Aspergillus aculeatinus CBS 121060 TaxID=1448322 RepID=A0ACD1GW89_9EURO|nr:thioredoxin [Aspergillus aculeatinus CBS 121060]RAH65730.1 thioredoxin [Aspergillus aculeatinus CBS 121060]
MDVELYVYDLSKGLARLYSMPLTGTQIDAIYHTSLVLNGVEYYYGQGIQTAVPGSTHHGQPMEKLHLGQTELPLDVIEEYIQSMAEIYTPESYDLFLHNCNNFTQDLAMFLLGKGIPEHIQNLPQTFLSTPFGQMMKPQIEMALRGVTQGTGTDGAQAPSASRPAAAAAAAAAATPAQQPSSPPVTQGVVRMASSLAQLEQHLTAASQSCAVIFFTSATCPPCRMVYPTYDELAEEAGDRAILIKVDISTAMDVSTKYRVRATPTFMTFLKGQKVDEWSGANPAQLRGNVRLLLEMATPTHRHRQLHLPSFQRHLPNYVTYKKIPPLDKLRQKLHPRTDDSTLTSILDFIQRRFIATSPDSAGAADVALPTSLPTFGPYLQTTLGTLTPENQFALVDLVRLLFLDPRVSGWFAAEDPHHELLRTLLSSANTSAATTPYPLRITLCQLACNLFTSPLYPDHFLSLSSQTNVPQILPLLLNLTTTSLLDPHPNLRIVAASFAYNLAAHNHNARFAGQPDPLPTEMQVELVASLVEALDRETQSREAVHGLLFALGLLVYEAPEDGEVVDLCKAMGVREMIAAKRRIVELRGEEALMREVGEVLLGRGL